ncbi:MAG: hypothetical protein J0M02_04660 [Planctomycetes bacterium]|nr:hypothetical protein [Planctomycetota bacterium]
MRRLVIAGLVLLLSACGGPEETAWSLHGDGIEPSGLRTALRERSAVHLRRIGVDGGLGDGVIRHPGVPAEAVAEAMTYACDDLPPELRRTASGWRLGLRASGDDHALEIPLAAGGR